MDVRFDGTVAMVTGAAGGLGRLYALGLAARSAKLVINDLGVARDGAGRSAGAAEAVVAKSRPWAEKRWRAWLPSRTPMPSPRR